MALIPITQNNFKYGELSKMLFSTIDDSTGISYAKSGLLEMKNFYVNNFGSISRRYGTEHIIYIGSAVINNEMSSRKVRIIPFSIGINESYIVIIQVNYIFIYHIQTGNLINNNLATPYSEDDFDSIYNWDNAGNTLYIVHEKYPIYTLTRKINNNVISFEFKEFKQIIYKGYNEINVYSGIITTLSKYQIEGTELILTSYSNEDFVFYPVEYGDNWIKVNVSSDYVENDTLNKDLFLGAEVIGNNIQEGTYITNVEAIAASYTPIPIPPRLIFFLSNKSDYSSLIGSMSLTIKFNNIISSNNIDYDIKNCSYRLSYLTSNEELRVVYVNARSGYVSSSSDATPFLATYEIIGGNISDAGDETGLPKETPIPLWEIEQGYDESSYANAVCVSDQRLFFTVGSQLVGSRLGVYNDFGVYENTITQTSPIKIFPFKEQDNKFNYLVDNDYILYAGTSNEVFRFIKSDSIESSSINYSANVILQECGSSVIPPIIIGSYFLILERNGIFFRIASYNSDSRFVNSIELTETNRNILVDEVKRIVYQQSPSKSIIFLKKNGECVMCKFSISNGIVYGGWSNIVMNDATIEDICIVPSSDGKKDNIYFIVKRDSDNPTTERSLELYNDELLPDINQKANFFDSLIKFQNPAIYIIENKKYIEIPAPTKNKMICITFDDNDVRPPRMSNDESKIEINEYEENLIKNGSVITCGYPFESKITTSPVEMLFENKYNSIGNSIRVNGINILYQNSIFCNLYDRNKKLLFEPNSLQNNEIFIGKDADVCEYKVNIIGEKMKRNTYFTLEIPENSSLPCNILSINYSVEI